MEAEFGHVNEQRETLLDELTGLADVDLREYAPSLEDVHSLTDLGKSAVEHLSSMLEAVNTAPAAGRHARAVRTVEVFARSIAAQTALMQAAIREAHATAAEGLADPDAVPGASRVHPDRPESGDKWLSRTKIAAANLGPVLGLGNNASQQRCRDADRLAQLPTLQDRMLAGEWDGYHHRLAMRAVRSLDDEHLPDLDAAIARMPVTVTPRELATRIDRWKTRHGQSTESEQKHREGMDDRFAWIGPNDLFGMSRLGGYLPSEILQPVWEIIEATADQVCSRNNHHEAADGRTREQVRADVLATLLHGPAALAPVLRPEPRLDDAGPGEYDGTRDPDPVDEEPPDEEPPDDEPPYPDPADYEPPDDEAGGETSRDISQSGEVDDETPPDSPEEPPQATGFRWKKAPDGPFDGDAATNQYDPVTGYPTPNEPDTVDALDVWAQIMALLRTVRLDLPAPPVARLNLTVPLSTILALQAGLQPGQAPDRPPPETASTGSVCPDDGEVCLDASDGSPDGDAVCPDGVCDHDDGLPPVDPRAWIPGIGYLSIDQLLWLISGRPELRRVITDDQTGAPIDLGAVIKHPNAPMRERVQLRDRTCRYPSCGALIHYPGRRGLDLDHIDPHRSDGTGGHTADVNLECVCPSHHRAKHQLPWQVTVHREDGSITWHNRQTGVTKTTYPDCR